MALCLPACAAPPPTFPKNDCTGKTRPAGISRFVLIQCDYEFIDIYDPNEWCAAVKAGKITVSGDIKGKISGGSPTKIKLSSCKPEVVTGREWTFEFEDRNADNVEFIDFDAYGEMMTNPTKYQFGMLTCNGDFIGFYDNWSPDISYEHGDDNKDVAYWAGKIMWNQIALTKPIIIPNLLNILNGNCEVRDYSGNS